MRIKILFGKEKKALRLLGIFRNESKIAPVAEAFLQKELEITSGLDWKEYQDMFIIINTTLNKGLLEKYLKFEIAIPTLN